MGRRAFAGAALVAVASVALLPPSAAAHPAGSCAVDRDDDRCERWSVTYDDESIRPPDRSDQFPTAVVSSATSVFTTVKDVALNPSSPYDATSTWVVLAHDAASGTLQWSASRRTRAYDSPLAEALSADGRRLFVTGAAYDAFPVGATDARVVTVAYDAATGAELWERTWDGRSDATDTGKTIEVSPDGRTVVVAGVTSTSSGDLDFLTVAYDSSRGRELWSRTASGVRPVGSDALSALAIDPRGHLVYVAGESAGAGEFDADYLTIAYGLRKGNRVWAQRYDGVGAHQSDRANALAVAPDGSRVFVTGDSWTSYESGSTQFDYATVAYDADSGAPRWEARYAGPVRGFNAPIGVVAAKDRVVVTGQSRGATRDDVRDFGTVAYDAASGTETWRSRYAPPRSDDVALAMALSADGATAYVTGSSSPVIPYTDLDETATVAYQVTDGSRAWVSRLDIGVGNALSPRALTAMPSGGAALAGQTTRSADPLEGPASNVYDAVIVGY